jgi:hypothetical protein
MPSGFTYKAFGLTIHSELECPELQITSGNADVIISLGQVPDALDQPLFSGVRFQTKVGEFLLHVDNVAKYHVTNGDRIAIEASPNAEVDDIRLFLLGSAFGALIHQRGLLPIHGSAININGSAVIFSGHSGAGKSTIAAAFYNRGYSILSDDVSVLSLSPDGKPMLNPGYPQMKLWADSIQKLGDQPSKYPTVRKKLEKHSIPVKSGFSENPIPLSKVFIVSSQNINKIEVEQVKGIEKFILLKNNTYRFNFIAGAQMRAAHFTYLDSISKQIDVIKISRPNGKFLFDEIIDAVLGKNN